ncbi:TonB-dependent siderophore receptor [Dyadobacter sp. CY312]|uniref:TonB-dependent receptor plug domain-containing protein n=1 Tax=Dyadobacter sp. CY312 TaxID=2907303 RepID=UPI001F472EE0|nr:TonB-dependent receptor [Dyadobacter sp. CY312]MCE7041063.1 TonB-dependent receptor [Dyadobacter sp. CY312]
MKNNLLRSTFLLLLFTSHYAIAQDISLDPVTITSSLIEKRASESGRNIAVIKGDYFQNLPVNSIDDLLRYVPGVEIQARGPMGSQSDIVLRGGTFQQVLVVLDGLRLNDPNTGHFSSYIPIAPSEIDRIEVLKGASSAIYGSEAVGGVIHVISKTFAAKLASGVDNENPISKTALNIGITGGQYGLRNANLGTFIQRNKLAVSAGLISNNADGVKQRGTNGYFHNNTASVSANYAISDAWNVAVRSSFDHRDFAAQNFYTTSIADTANEQVKTSWNHLKVGYKKGKSALSFDGGYKYVKDQYLFNSRSIRNNSVSELWQGLITWQQTLSQKTYLVTGVNYQNKNISSNDRGDHDIHQLAPFITLSHRIGEYFTVSPAIRFDWRQRIGTEVIPQVNLSFKKDIYQLRGSAGKTIRDADFTERYNNYNKPIVTTGNKIGSPDLKAERSFSYEAGADLLLPGLKLSATFFQRLQKDLIDYTNTPYAEMPRKDNLTASGTYALAKNVAEVNTTGFEFDVQYTKTITAKQKLWLTAGLTQLNSESSDVTPSFYVSSHAKLLTNFSVLYQHSGFSLSINGLYKTRAKQEASTLQATISPAYFLLNAKAEYAFLQKTLAVFIQTDNTFNKKYSDLLGAVMPGRWLMAGVRYNLVR